MFEKCSSIYITKDFHLIFKHALNLILGFLIYNIYLDTDYLISSGTTATQNTWMDAKCEGIAATPRNGKAVEINSLVQWINDYE